MMEAKNISSKIDDAASETRTRRQGQAIRRTPIARDSEKGGHIAEEIAAKVTHSAQETIQKVVHGAKEVANTAEHRRQELTDKAGDKPKGQ